MEEFNKVAKNLKNDMLVIFILEVIVIAGQLLTDLLDFNIFSVVFAAATLCAYLGAKNQTKTAGTIGLIIGILMLITILASDIIDAVLGLIILLHSVKYNKLYKIYKENNFANVEPTAPINNGPAVQTPNEPVTQTTSEPITLENNNSNEQK